MRDVAREEITPQDQQIKVPARDCDVWETPLYKQYWNNKDKCPGALLFFRLGDFYELFGQDAVDAAPVMGVQLTARNKDKVNAVPMCGVPAHAVDAYAEKILASGRKVALCEQIEEASPQKKLVERDIIRILTPGLSVDLKNIQETSAHWLMAVGVHKTKIEVELFDFLRSEHFSGDLTSAEELQELIKRVRPQEILWPQSIELKGDWKFLAQGSPWYSKITPWIGKQAFSNLEDYLIYTQRCSKKELSRYLPPAKPLKTYTGDIQGDYAQISSTVIEQWGVESHLFELLNFCGSAMGARKLRSLLTKPLYSAARIQNRQQVLQNLIHYKKILGVTKNLYDFERILGRFRVGVAVEKELLRFCSSLAFCKQVFQFVNSADEAWKEFLKFEDLQATDSLWKELDPLLRHLQASLDLTVDLNRTKTLAPLIKKGLDSEFDRLKEIQDNAEQWLSDYQHKWSIQLGIPSLKIRYNRVFGYFIEVTKTHLSKIPPEFVRKQTMVNAERFSTKVLQEREAEILSAEIKLEARARDILGKLKDEVLSFEGTLKVLVDQVALLDAFSSVLKATNQQRRFGDWNYPKISKGKFYFKLKEARHPVMSALLGSGFVANSLSLGQDEKKILLLTGPNMAGKSTLMRQTGLCLLLAQCGFMVPARSLESSPCSGFYSRMGASDNIFEGDSTFMVEMKETADILNKADKNAFILVDEVGRGTSTQDGLAIAKAVLHHLHHETDAICIFATHFHELSENTDQYPQIRNASLAIKEWKGELLFLRELVDKPAQSSYGIFVARLAGLPATLVEEASRNLQETKPLMTKLSKKKKATSLEQMDFLSQMTASESSESVSLPEEVEVIDKLKQTSIDDLSPRQAWILVEQWQKLLDKIDAAPQEAD